MEAKSEKRRISCFAQAVFCFLALAVLLIAAFFLWNQVAGKRFKQGIARLREAGFMTTEAELMESYQVDGANPGQLWIEAGTSLEESGPSVVKLPFIGAEGEHPVPPPGKPWDQLEAAKAYLDKHADVLALIDRAAQTKSPARYDIDFVPDKPGVFDIPYSSTHRHITRVLQMACHVYAHEGNMAELTKTICNGLRVGHSLSDEPNSMGQLLSVACTAMMMEQVGNFISSDFTNEQLQEIQRALRETSPQESLLRGLEGETVLIISNFQGMTLGPIPRHDDGAFFVEQMLPLLEVAKTEGWKEIREVADNALKNVNELEGPNKNRYMLSSMSLPSTIRLVDAEARLAAQLLVYDSLVAARRFYLENERHPTSLVELVPKYLPQIPIDPYSKTGESLILSSQDAGTKIYSRGYNLTDDGGDPTPDNETRRPIDVVAELPAK